LSGWNSEKDGTPARQLDKKERIVSMAVQVFTRHDLEAKIVQRSWEDEGFRGKLLADPIGAFCRHFEVPADGAPRIVVHEETPGSWHIVLPSKSADASELSDTDLEKLAGGGSPVVVATVVGTIVWSAIISVSVSAPVTVVEEGW
jgi:hypothetical protein